MTYEYHSRIFGSPVQVTYNKHGKLVGIKVMLEDEIETLTTQEDKCRIHYDEQAFLDDAKAVNLKLTKVVEVVSFDQFWEAYREKNCGRKKGEAAWNALTKTEQVEAFKYIARLDNKLKQSGTAKPYATTYLNQKRWIQ